MPSQRWTSRRGSGESWWIFRVEGEPSEVAVVRFVLEEGKTVRTSMEGAEEAQAREEATAQT